jgi:hypothetical protein
MNTNSANHSSLFKQAIALLLCIVALCITLGLILFRDDHWTLAEVEKYLGTSIPKDAQNLTYISGTNRYVYVQLNFSASPSSVLNFASHFCDGILHQGYDPFNAINTDDKVEHSVKVDIVDYHTRSYYSYSPHASHNQYGVFCYLYSGLYWVLVDQSNPTLYTMRFKHVGSRVPIQLDRKPIADFPIIVRGLGLESPSSYSADGTLCFDLDPDVVTATNVKWRSLLGADIEILIDGKAMNITYVNNEGHLTHKDNNNVYNDPDSNIFQYCLLMLQRGLHTITIQLPSSFAGTRQYSWTVRGVQSASCEGRNNCIGA